MRKRNVSVKRLLPLVVALSILFGVLIAHSLGQPADYGSQGKGKVVITFDDVGIDDSVWQTAYPIMRSFGFTGVAFCIVGSVNRPAAIQNLTKLVYAGWEIGSHTYWHEDLTKVSGKWLLTEVADSKTWLNTHIPYASVTSLAYPHSATNQTVISVVSQYYVLARTSSWWAWQSHTWNGYKSYEIPSITIADSNYQYNVLTAINMAKASGQTVVLTFHTVNSTNVNGCAVSPEHFKWIMNQILASRLLVQRFKDFRFV